MNKLTNENKHIKLGNMVTYVTGTKKKREEDKGRVAECSNKHCRDRKMDKMSMYPTEKGPGGEGVAAGTQEQEGN
jgi:hypothetical protein